MNRIIQPQRKSQEIFYIFHFPTKKLHINTVVDNTRIEAQGSLKTFDRLDCFYWLEDENKEDRTVTDLILDYERSASGRIKIELTPEIIELMPGVDVSTITFRIHGREKVKGDPIGFYDIEMIIIMAETKDKRKTYDREGKILIREKTQDGDDNLTTVYRGPGAEDWNRREEKKDESKKPDLYIVPKQDDAKKKKKRFKTVPTKIMQYAEKNYQRGEWKRILRGLHKWSIYRERCEDKHYPGKSERKNRQYVWGQEWLAGKLDYHRNTINNWFKRFEADGIIYIPYRGYMDRGASIIELAYTEGHRRKNKRKTGER